MELELVRFKAITSMETKTFQVNEPPTGYITDDTLKIVSSKLDDLKHNEILIKTLMLSVDPSNRIAIGTMQVDDTPIGYGLAQVIRSKSNRLKVGDIVFCQSMTWSTYQIKIDLDCIKIPYNNDPDIPLSYYLGALSIVGITAYYGLLHIGQCKNNENVFITGCAGATGSIAAQIAKNIKVDSQLTNPCNRHKNVT